MNIDFKEEDFLKFQEQLSDKLPDLNNMLSNINKLKDDLNNMQAVKKNKTILVGDQKIIILLLSDNSVSFKFLSEQQANEYYEGFTDIHTETFFQRIKKWLR